jgi:hypothetical protein
MQTFQILFCVSSKKNPKSPQNRERFESKKIILHARLTEVEHEKEFMNI